MNDGMCVVVLARLDCHVNTEYIFYVLHELISCQVIQKNGFYFISTK